MTTHELIQRLRSRGVRFRVTRQGLGTGQVTRLLVKSPGRIQPDEFAFLRRHKSEAIEVLESSSEPSASSADQDLPDLIPWFMQNCDRLPRDPFQLFRWSRVSEPGRFYKYLQRDIAAGPSDPRQKFGGLRTHLSRLRELFGNEGPP